MRQRNPKLNPEEKEALKARIFDELGLDQPGKSDPDARQMGVPALRRWLAVAAALVLIAVPAYMLLRKKTTTERAASPALAFVRTGRGETRQIILPDSSIVLLNGDSEISWPADFLHDSSRHVQFTGNAFFHIRKRPEQPRFTVYTGSLAIAVLGTEFNVNARTAATEVALVRGRVNVSQAGKEAGATVLRPGEKVRLDTLGSNLIRSGMNSEMYSAWTDNKWNFNRTRLDEILSVVQAYYGVKPVFANEQRRALRITASIKVTSLEDLVAVIENTLQIRIKQENNQLLVQ